MEESESTATPRGTKLKDNPDEISWVFYGIVATISMVLYQFMLVEVLNVPSTISVKMVLSLAIGVVAILIVSAIKISRFWKRKRQELRDRRSMAQASDEILIDPLNDSQFENRAIERKNSLWKYMVGFVNKIK